MSELQSSGYMPGAYMNVPSNIPAGSNVGPQSGPLFTVDTRGEFSKGIGRGWEGLKSLGYGAAGLGADIVGAEGTAQSMYESALRHQEIAGKEYTPAVAQFTDIASAGNLYDWFLGAAGEALPSSALSLVTGGVGAKLFQTMANKLVTNSMAQQAVRGLANKYMAEGIAATTEKATELAVKKYFGAELGAYVGTMASSSGMEAGSNWLDDVQKHGLKGTDPIKDLLFGIAGGAVEAGLGAERRLIGKLAADKTAKELTQAASRGLVKSIGLETGKSMAGEGGEEFVQQMLNQSATMRNASLTDMLYDKQDWKQNINAGMAGAAGGVLFGATGGTKDYLGSRGYKAPGAPSDAPSIAAPLDAPLEEQPKSVQVKTEQATAQKVLTNTIKDQLLNFDKQHQQLSEQKNNVLKQLWEMEQSPATDPAAKEQSVSDLTAQFMQIAAQQTANSGQRAEYMKGAEAFANKTNKKYESEWLKATAQEQDSIPTDEQGIFAAAVAAGRKAESQGLLDARAKNEAAKSNTRVEQHQLAIANLSQQMNDTRSQGGIVDFSTTDLVSWHEKQIEDERKFLKNLESAHSKATEDKIGANDLFNLFRDKDHAVNQIAAKYNVAAEAVQQQAWDGSKTAQDGPTTLRNRLNALRATKAMADGFVAANAHGTLADRLRSRSSALAEEAGRQMATDMSIQRDIDRGVLPTALPYSERSTERVMPAAVPYARAEAASPQQMLSNRDAIRQRLTQWSPFATEQQAPIVVPAPIPTTVISPRQYIDQVKEAKANARTADAIAGEQAVSKTRVATWIAPTLNKLSALTDKVKIIHSSELTTLPDYVQKEYRGGNGIIDLRSGIIYLVADKLGNKTIAVRTLLHEAVAHFGLRSIMNAGQLRAFLNMVARDFVGTKTWGDVKNKYPEYDTVSLAEEYVARFAEQIYIDQKTGEIGFDKKHMYSPEKALTIFQKIKDFISSLLQAAGMMRVTEQDIRDTLLASVYNLANNKPEYEAAMSGVRNTLEKIDSKSDNFKNWFGDSKIVDDKGNPTVVYHGSPNDFHTFKLSKEGALGSGIYVTPVESYASDYTGTKERSPMALYARVTNPIVIDITKDPGVYPEVLVLQQLGMARDKAMSFADKVYDDKGGFTKELLSRAQKYGHDGIIAMRDGKISELVLFNASQLKSADKNSGEFNPYSKNIFESRDTAVPTDKWQTTQSTPTYKTWLGRSGNFLKDLTTKTYGKVEEGKVLLSNVATFREKAITAVADTYHAVSNLEELVKMAGGVIPTEMKTYIKEKLSHNIISTQVGDFLQNTIGMDPQSPSYSPKEGTLFWKMMRAADGVTIPTNPKQALEVFGKIAQAYHAKEANLALALKSIDHEQLARVEKKIENIQSEIAEGKNLRAEVATKLEQDLSEAKQLRDRILSPRQDLYGMSNEEADIILGKKEPTKEFPKSYVNEKNALQIQEIMQDIQKINKQIMDKAVAEGLLDPKLRKLWDETYAYYVPNTKFQQEMVKISPSYANSSRYTNFGLWELSEERMGTDTLGSNPIVSLALKMEDVIRVAEEKKVITALFRMFAANKEMLSEVAEKDNRGEIKEFSQALKDIMAKADKILSGERVESTRDIIKGLRKRILEMKLELVKEQRKMMKAATDETKAKHDIAINKLEKDILNAQDAIAEVRDQITQAKNNPEYISLRQQAKEIIAARKRLYDERGFSRYIDERGVIKWKKNPSKFTGQMDRVITGFDENGNKVRYLIKNDHLLASIRGTHMFKSEAVIKFLGKAQRIMAQLMTTFSPAFVAVNFFRDWLTANIHIRHLASDLDGLGIDANELSKRFNSKVFASLKNIYADAREGKITDGYWADKFADYQKYGGYTSMYNLGNWASSEKMMVSALKRAEEGKSDKMSTKKALYATMNWMQDASGAVENSNRLAAFATLSDALIEAGMNKEQANILAADAALDLTVNFTKKGTWGPILSSLFLFSQASINSTLRISRAMFPAADKGKPFISMKGWKDQRRVVRYGAGLMGIALIASSLARAIGGDDDDGVPFYDKLPDYIKTTNLVIAVGRNTFLKIPMAFGYAVPYTLGIVASDLASGRTGILKGTGTLFSSMMQNFFIVGGGDEGITALTPTLFKPLVQIYANKNYFGGKVIPEQKDWEKGEKPDSQRAWKTTAPMFKLIAETINTLSFGDKDRAGLIDISPASMEYAFKQYLGGVGDLGIKVANLTAGAMFGKAKEIDFSDIPIISRFAVQSTYPNTLHEYSKIKTEIEIQLNELKRAKTEVVSPSELADVYRKTQAARLLTSKLDSVHKQMAETAKQENKMMNNPNIPEETKYNMRTRNEEKNAVILKQFIKAAHMVGVNPK